MIFGVSKCQILLIGEKILMYIYMQNAKRYDTTLSLKSYFQVFWEGWPSRYPRFTR